MIKLAASNTGNRASNRVSPFAMSIMVIAMLIIPGMDIIGKVACNPISKWPRQASLFARFVVQAILMSMLIIIRTKTGFRSK